MLDNDVDKLPYIYITRMMKVHYPNEVALFLQTCILTKNENGNEASVWLCLWLYIYK